ncbi:MAG: DUF2141 domain-containing protein [Candidatus Marinimicrobia bacterium]|nr:DUF2141 domain-containing protein [Candidatus Neomarinimicrobiota bacterium]
MPRHRSPLLYGIRTPGCLVLFFCLFVLTGLGAQVNLKIEIRHLESARGDILLEVLDRNEQTLRAFIQTLDSTTVRIDIPDMDPGTYAVKFFHDSNANGILDLSRIGIPLEGFGFSNNAYGLFMPKKFGEWLFRISGDTTICLTPKYLKFP